MITLFVFNNKVIIFTAKFFKKQTFFEHFYSLWCSYKKSAKEVECWTTKK